MIEESPSPLLEPREARRDGPHRVRRRRSLGYQNVGTVEFLRRPGRQFLLPGDEHPPAGRAPGDRAGHGHRPGQAADRAGRRRSAALRAARRGLARPRASNAASPPKTRRAASRRTLGTSTPRTSPGGPWVRVDTHVFPGYTTPPYYDSLLAKIIVWGRNRNESIARMRRAIDETEIQGVKTNLDYLALVLSDPRFQAGDVDVEFVERQLSELLRRRRRWRRRADAGACRSTSYSNNSGAIFPPGPFLDRRLGRAFAFQALYEMDQGHHSPNQVLERLADRVPRRRAPIPYSAELLTSATQLRPGPGARRAHQSHANRRADSAARAAVAAGADVGGRPQRSAHRTL